MTDIAAIIPCYNAEPFLADALRSVLAQTRPVARVVVVDDGSSDGTVQVAESFRAQGHPVEVMRTPVNGGPGSARNVALRAAREPLVAFLDADDTWTPEHCAVVAGMLDRHPEAALAFARGEWLGGGVATPHMRWPDDEPIDLLVEMLRDNGVIQSAVVARRAELLAVGGYAEGARYAEDYDLWLRLLVACRPFVGTHRVTCCRRRHPGQASAAMAGMFHAAWATRERALATLPPSDPRYPAVEDALRYTYDKELGWAWGSRSRDILRGVLALDSSFADLEPVRERWRRRERLVWPFWLPAARLWDSMPERWRATLRRLRARTASQLPVASA